MDCWGKSGVTPPPLPNITAFFSSVWRLSSLQEDWRFEGRERSVQAGGGGQQQHAWMSYGGRFSILGKKPTQTPEVGRLKRRGGRGIEGAAAGEGRGGGDTEEEKAGSLLRACNSIPVLFLPCTLE